MATVTKRRWPTGTGTFKEAWRVRYVDQHGKDRTRQFDKKRDAEAFRVKAEGEVAAGVHTADRASVTVAEAAGVWLAACESNCDRGTLKTYGEIVRCHILPLIGDKKLSRLDRPAVITFRDALLMTRSHAMASKAVRHLSMILNDVQGRGLVAQNVALGVTVKRPRADGKRQRLAKRAEIAPLEHLKLMLEAADRLGKEDPRLPVMVRLAMLAGPRASEIRALSWAGVDLQGGTLSITQRADRWNHVGPPKSDASYRSIPIGPALVSMLRAWKLRCPPSALGLVFPATRRDRRWASERATMGLGPIKQSAMPGLLLQLQVGAGIAIDSGKRTATGEIVWGPRYDWHHLRHVAASNWINDGIDMKRLQVWIGHENIQLTLDVYGHLITDARRDAALAAGAERALLG